MRLHAYRRSHFFRGYTLSAESSAEASIRLKSEGLLLTEDSKGLGQLALHYHRIFSEGRPLSETRVLDVASAEGGLSIAFAEAGAKEVVGIEGRSLYVNRANFVAKALGHENVATVLGDVREIRPSQHGKFDFTINSGILHHLGQPDFLPFLQSMADVTRDAMFLYTHVSTPAAVADFRLRGPVIAADRFEGYLLQEHPEDATPEERERQVRASLDNTYSFWATEEALIAALKNVGFKTIVKMFEPHVFGGYVNRNPARRLPLQEELTAEASSGH